MTATASKLIPLQGDNLPRAALRGGGLTAEVQCHVATWLRTLHRLAPRAELRPVARRLRSRARRSIILVAADTAAWQCTTSPLEQAALAGTVKFYPRHDQLGLTVPYQYTNLNHYYERDHLVRLRNGLTLLLELKGMETDQDRAKHEAARRWVLAVNNWGELGQWRFQVCRDPQMLALELRRLAESSQP